MLFKLGRLVGRSFDVVHDFALGALPSSRDICVDFLGTLEMQYRRYEFVGKRSYAVG